MEKKKVIIIGGGVSGIATGTYLQMNGYNTVVLEKNAIAGGACIGWERKGCYIDGCIHWLSGTKPTSATYKLWNDVGALSPDVEIFEQDDYSVIDYEDGKKLTIWSDLEKLRKELLAFAPEDEKQINKFCKLVKRFERIDAPVNKPVDLMNLFDLLKIGFTMAGDYVHLTRTSKLTCGDYAKKFKNPYIRRWITDQMVAGYNFMSLVYMLSRLTAKNGGIPIGGSKQLVDRMIDKYLSLGGELKCATEVESVNVLDGIATGVTLKNGQIIDADWIVSTSPAEYTLKTLLQDKYRLKAIHMRLRNRKVYPIYTFTTAVFKVNADLSNAPLSHKIHFKNPIVLNEKHFSASFRNYSYDKTLKRPEGHTVVEATLGGDDVMYYWWKKVKENGTYKEKKQEIANLLKEVYLERYPELEGKIDIIDVITPMTYERYLYGRHGSFQGFVETHKGKSLMSSGKIKGLKNFFLSGQWVLRTGGLPPAVITAKFVTQRICKKDKIKFKTV